MSEPLSPAKGTVTRLWFVARVVLARLRFVAILGAIGFVFVKWDDLVARYEMMAHPTETVTGDYEFFCPMHPTVIRETNKEKCPICFMPLSKRKKGNPSEDSLPAGTVARVQLTPYRIVLAGIQTVPVTYQPLHKTITTVGTVEFDERSLRNVSARFKGRIDQLFVNQTGQMVHEGDPLASLYSPELVVTVQNLLDAKSSDNKELQKTARDRLRLWGIDDPQIDAVVKSGKPITHLTIRSPITGHVIKKYLREGQYVEEGGTLFDVADLSNVWVQTRFYEDDLAFLPRDTHDLKTGGVTRSLPVTATTRAFPGKAFPGVLSFLFPHVDVESRTLTVRFDLKNADHALRPGMTAMVTLPIGPELFSELPVGEKLLLDQGKVLAIPESSVIDTGNQTVVYRQDLPGTFDEVLVELGSRLSSPTGEVYYPVLSGLKPGDLVVTSGSFLIDAETRLNPALASTYIGGNGSKSNPATRPTTPQDRDAKVVAGLSKLSAEDRKIAEKQRFCPELEDTLLGEMGKPIKLILKGQTVFVCCKTCVKAAEENPETMLKKLRSLEGRSPVNSQPLPKE